MTRFLTRWFVTTDLRDAERLSRAHGGRFEAVLDVDLVHVGEGWAYWSDGEVTTSTGLTDAQRAVRSLSPAAAKLVADVYLAGGGPPRCTGGYATLAAIAEVVSDELLEEGHADGDFEPPRWRRFVVRMGDGAERVLWVFEEAFAEGVRFEVGDTQSAIGAGRKLSL